MCTYSRVKNTFRTENRTPESIESAWKCCRNEIIKSDEVVLL